MEPSFLTSLRALPALGLMLAAAPAFAAGDVQEGWRLLGSMRTEAAIRKFSEMDGREARLGQAVALLVAQPKTPGNIEEAVRHLSGLAERQPRDDIGVAALYYLARVEQLHRYTPDFSRAMALFEELTRSHPEHSLAQRALVKMAVLRLYALPLATNAEQLLEQLGELGNQLVEPDTTRDFHLVLADGAAHHRLPPETSLRHLLQAERTGRVTGNLRADVLVRLGELSNRTGEPEQAAKFYRLFLEEFPRNERALMVRERLEDVR